MNISLIFKNAAGIPKGWLSPWFWVSNREESSLLAHDFACEKSSVAAETETTESN